MWYSLSSGELKFLLKIYIWNDMYLVFASDYMGVEVRSA